MSLSKILLIEDCQEVQVMVRAALSRNFDLKIASSLKAAFELIQNNSFDLFLVDIVLPDGDGFSLCSQLRSKFQTKSIPLFFLTSKSESQDKVKGFSIGADDYIVKPFDPLELRARVEAKLRKVSEGKLSEESLQQGRFRLELSSQKAYAQSAEGEQELKLSPNEFRLLLYLMRHDGHILKREQLLNSVWGPSVKISDRTVDAHVCNLRKKISHKRNHIESISGTGYRFQSADL